MLAMTAGLLVALLVAVNTLLIWVATGPRSLATLTPAIESALSASDGSFRVAIGETWLLWDGWKHPVDIRLKQVDVLTGEGQVFSSFPEVAIGLHIPSLLLGRILPTSLALDKPVVSLLQHADRSVSFGFRQNAADNQEHAQPQTLPLALLFAAVSQQDDSGPLRKLRSVRISQADISVGSEVEGVVFQASGVDIRLKRSRRLGLALSLSGKLRYDEFQSNIGAELSMLPGQQQVTGRVDYEGVDVAALVDLFTEEDKPVPLSMPISGQAYLTLDADGSVRSLQLKGMGGMGELRLAELPDPLAISWARFDLTVQDGMNTLSIAELSADLDGAALTASGKLQRNDQQQLAIAAKASLANVPTARVAALWPLSLAPITREWVTGNITDGSVTQASVVANLGYGDLDLPALPKTSIDASIRLSGATIRYLPDHPPARQVEALIRVDGVAMEASVERADYMEATRLSNGQVVIADLNADNPYIELALQADSNAQEAARFLALPKLEHASRLNMNPASMSGKVSAAAKVGFYFFAPKDEKGQPLEPDIDYNVTATLTEVSAPGFMHKFDISQASGDVTVSKEQLEFKGSGTINSAKAKDVQVRYLFAPKDGLDTFITAQASAGRQALERFGLPPLGLMSGEIGVKAEVRLGAALEQADLTLDLTPAAIQVNDIAWSKPQGEPATLALKSEKKSGLLSIDSFELKGKQLEATGSLALGADMKSIAKASLSRLNIGTTSLSKLDYSRTADGMALSVAGARADLSGFLDDSGDKATQDFSFANFPAIKLELDVAELAMAGGTKMTAVKGHLHCTVQRCESADIGGAVSDKPFRLRIYREPKTVRQFSLRAEDAGEFLKSVALYDRMEGGVLTINGQFVDTPGSSSLLRARMDITEHTIRKAPVLAKILTLASLTGFFDMLEGNGIRFTKMVIPFSLQNDVITVSKARAFGNAIGITAEGTITFPAVLFDVRGTVVPSYAANTILGKLPIIGDVLTGGEGKGVFAGNYSVKGTYQDPKVTVNPLSILTPGVLRGIFDVGGKG